MGTSLLFTGDIAGGRAHLNSGIALYDPADHRSLATRFGQDVRVALLCYRALTLWILGYIEAALSDADQALREARKIGQAATSMYALFHVSAMHLCCENYATANALVSEFVALSDEKGAFFWKAQLILRGCVLAQTGHSAEAVQMITAGSSAYRSTGARSWLPLWSSYLGRAYAKLGQVGHAWGCVKEALTAAETTKERVFLAEVNRIAGNIALILPEPDEAKALDYFQRALSVARQQQAKSWELRTAMSMARLWRDQGKREEARELLAPVYGWFTEGFDTLDLKEAKALLGELKQ
jgi:predicted ATPase